MRLGNRSTAGLRPIPTGVIAQRSPSPSGSAPEPARPWPTLTQDANHVPTLGRFAPAPKVPASCIVPCIAEAQKRSGPRRARLVGEAEGIQSRLPCFAGMTN